MKTKFSNKWKSSKQPRKQRKYRYNAPLHIKHKFLAAHLSKELKDKYKKKAIPIRKNDTVKVFRGQFKGKSGKISKIILRKTKIYIEGIEQIKKDGTKTFYPIHPSNVIIVDIDLKDKIRKEILGRK